MGSTSTSTPGSISAGTVQNQVFRDQHIHGDQIFNARSDAGQALVWDCLKSLAYPEMNDRSNTIRISTRGTCDWLLQHDKWKSWKSSQRGLLWIKGKPGSGKSTLLRYALHELKSTKTANKALILSFFFHGRGNDLQKNQLGLFRSLLHQVLSEMPDELTKLVTTFEQRRHGIGRPGVAWAWELDELQQLFKWSILDVLKSRPVWIFIDALDESGAENAKAVIRHFKDLLQGPSTLSKLQICFACRHYPVQSWEGGFEICTEHENRQDILTYVRAQLSDFQITTTLALPDIITERSNGLFIWARLVVEQILDLDLADDPRSADQLVNNIIDTLPRDLNTLYADIVRDIEKTSASLKLMQLVSCAMQRLSLDELRWAMVINPDLPQTSLQDYKSIPDYIESNDVMERRVRALSHGLVEIISPFETRRVQFIHQSVKDFFDNRAPEPLEEASGDRSFSTTKAAHYTLYRTCIHYLAMEEFQFAQLPNPEERGFWELEINEQVNLTSPYALLSYATDWWMVHLEESQERHQEGFRSFSWPPTAILKQWIKVSWLLYMDVESTNGIHIPPLEATLVHVLARHGLVAALQTLLSCGEPVDINARDELDRTPLLYAAEQGQTATVQVLLTAGAEVDSRDLFGAAPLHWAAFKGHISTVRLLLVRGAVAHLKDKDGLTPLVWAMEAKREAVIKMLLDEAGDLNCEYVLPSDFHTTFTIGGVSFGGVRFHGVDSRIRLSSGPPYLDTFSNFPWMYKEYPKTFSDLDEYLSVWQAWAKLFGSDRYYSRIGPRRESATRGDRTPLLRAVELGSESIVSILLAKGADPALHCRTGWSPLLLANLRRNSSDQAVVGLLEAHRGDSNT